jgi:hypothetical protein
VIGRKNEGDHFKVKGDRPSAAFVDATSGLLD